jgi:tripeptide aminopeptidase
MNLGTLLELLSLPGKSGQERLIADYVKAALIGIGVPSDCVFEDDAYERTAIRGDAGNLIVRLPGTRPGPRRLFTAHMDTVPICVGAKPVVEEGHITSEDPQTGLGGDDRTGVGVLLETITALVARRAPHPPTTFCFFVQEEVGLHGARCVRVEDLGNPAYAFNFDGGSPAKLTIGATGGYRLSIEVFGRASHAGGAPEEGISAIVAASRAIADLAARGWLGKVEKEGRSGTSNVGVFNGGHATNVVTDRVSLRAEARSHDPAFRREIVSEIEEAFRGACVQTSNVRGESARAEFQGRLDYESFAIDPNCACVAMARQALERLGSVPELAISNGGLDANWLNAHGITTVTLGCGQRSIHTVEERVDLADYALACKTALELATCPDIGSGA